jgi:hypothetical protein
MIGKKNCLESKLSFYSNSRIVVGDHVKRISFKKRESKIQPSAWLSISTLD